MKLLLTSEGITNNSIAEALSDLVGKTPAETKIGYVPTARNVEPGKAHRHVDELTGLLSHGFTSIDLVDPTAQGVDWRQRLDAVDVIFLSGGNTHHLLDSLRKTGADEWIRENLEQKVFVGVSAGTIVLTKNIEVANIPPADPNIPGITDFDGLGLVEFEVEPHCEGERFGTIEAYANQNGKKVYAIDDQSAIKVVDSVVEVISEGQWKLYD